VEEWGVNFQARCISVRLENIKFKYLVVVIVLLASFITPLIKVTDTYASNDDYPSQWKNAAMDSMFDSWGEYNRECTSFVAWRLSSKNGYNMPFYDNAMNWAADAKARGIMVDSSPALGSVAYKGNHVAWVESVSTDKTKVTLEEYNEVDSNSNGVYGDDGTYSERTVAANMFQYIHFKDLGAFTQSSNSTDVANSYKGKMVRNSVGTVMYVAASGLKSWVQDGNTVNCLGGWGAVVQLNDSQFDSIPTYWTVANCSSKYIGKLVRDPGGTISYVDATGLKHWVPTMGVVGCLGGSYIQLDSTTFSSMPNSPSTANCLSTYTGRMLRNPDGTVAYTDINLIKHWVPDNTTVGCLGGWGAIIQTDNNTFNSIGGAQTSNCGSIYLGRMLHAPDGTVVYVSSDGYMHWVPNGDVVNCLGGWGAVLNVDWNTFGQFPAASMADCSTR
jgi:surface antigen